MKIYRLLSLFVLFFCSRQIVAQSPIVGTWEVESISTTSPEGKKTSVDKTSIKALLLITPTHFAEVARTSQGDSSIFWYADYGSYSLKGNEIKQTFLVSSKPEIKDRTIDVIWTVKGTQATFVTVSKDSAGRKNITEKTARKVKLPAQLSGEVLGTWIIVSGTATTEKGSESFDPSKSQIINVLTPTHRASVFTRDEQLINLIISPIIKKGEIVHLDWGHSISYRAGYASSQFTLKIKDGKLHINWTNVRADGKVIKRDELMERVEGQKVIVNR